MSSKSRAKELLGKILHPWYLILFIFICFICSGNAAIKNTACFSSPCGDWVLNTPYHLESNENLLLAPGFLLMRAFVIGRDQIDVKFNWIFFFPIQSMKILSGSLVKDDVSSMRLWFAIFTLFKLIHIPIWILMYWAFEQIWKTGKKWVKALGYCLVFVIVFIFLTTLLGNCLLSNTGYQDVTTKIFFNPSSAVYVSG